MQKILLTGGWGYRNIGDDALLEATIHWIEDTSENNIQIITYDKANTQSSLGKSIQYSLVESPHRIIFGEDFRCHYLDKQPSFWDWRVFNRISSRLKYEYIKNIIRRLSHKDFIPQFLNNHKELKDAFESCDILLLSGGGYLDCWIESLIGKYVEVLCAKHYEKKVIMRGTTFGPFSSSFNMKEIVERFVTILDDVTVRDLESKNDLIKYGYNKNIKITPDFALYKSYEHANDFDTVSIIPFVNLFSKEEELAKAMSTYYKSTRTKIQIVLTQQWKQPYSNGILIQNCLAKEGVRATIQVPSNLKELQNLLRKSKLCISQNLHGLILSYRCGTPIISINDKRKFKNFMNRIGAESYILPLETISAEALLQAMNSVPYRPYDVALKEEILCSNPLD